jgi:hypothetical protein
VECDITAIIRGRRRRGLAILIIPVSVEVELEELSSFLSFSLTEGYLQNLPAFSRRGEDRLLKSLLARLHDRGRLHPRCLFHQEAQQCPRQNDRRTQAASLQLCLVQCVACEQSSRLRDKSPLAGCCSIHLESGAKESVCLSSTDPSVGKELPSGLTLLPHGCRAQGVTFRRPSLASNCPKSCTIGLILTSFSPCALTSLAQVLGE